METREFGVFISQVLRRLDIINRLINEENFSSEIEPTLPKCFSVPRGNLRATESAWSESFVPVGFDLSNSNVLKREFGIRNIPWEAGSMLIGRMSDEQLQEL